MPDDAATGGPPDSAPADDAQEPRHGHLAGRRRVVVFVGCGVVTLVAAVVLFLRPGGGDDTPEPTTGLDAWAPYWALEDSLPEVAERSDELRELSPFWYAAEGVDRIVVDGNAPAAEVEAFLSSARDADARLVPSVVDALPPGEMADAAGRSGAAGPARPGAGRFRRHRRLRRAGHRLRAVRLRRRSLDLGHNPPELGGVRRRAGRATP